MRYHVTCDCGQQVIVDDDAGTRAACPRCKRVLNFAPPPPSPPPVVPVMPYGGGVQYDVKPRLDPITRGNWRIAAVMVGIIVVLQFASIVVRESAGRHDATIQAVVLLILTALGVTICSGLAAGMRWAKWTLLVVASLAVALIAAVAIQGLKTDPAYAILLLLFGLAMLAGWILLLDEPGTRAKLIAGVAILGVLVVLNIIGLVIWSSRSAAVS